LTSLDLNKKFDPTQILELSKFSDDTIISAIYFEGERTWTMVKRFKIETLTLDQKFLFISESTNSKLYFATTHETSEIQVTYKSGSEKVVYDFILTEFIDIKGWKAMGNKFLDGKLIKVVETNYSPVLTEDFFSNEIPKPIQGDLFKDNIITKETKLKSGDTIEFELDG
jgi:topoisomerase-4 subunit A